MDDTNKKDTSEATNERQENDASAGLPIDQKRRQFLAGLAAIGGTAGAIQLGAGQLSAKDVRSKILSRIQEEIQRDHLDDPMSYDKSGTSHSKYSKGGGGSKGSGS